MKKLQLLPVLALCLTAPVLAQRAQQADQFVDSAGINTHLTYTNTSYMQWSKIFAALKAMHVRHIRDGYYLWPDGSAYYGQHQQLHAAGIDCDYVVTKVPDADDVATFKGLVGDMAYLEAPNEMDDKKGSDWAKVLHQALPPLYEAGTASQLSVLGPSLVYKASYVTLGDVAADMTENNLHIYFGGRNPGSSGWGNGDAQRHRYGSIPWWLDNAQVDGPGNSSVVTETGYLANPKVTPYTLPQDIEAKYTMRTLLEMFNAGITRTYLYEMVDEVSSPGYGIMTSDLKPKLAYIAVANLLGLLDDPGPGFIPDGLDYTLTGASSSVHQLLLQKHDKSFYLVLWIEASGYNPATNTVTPVPVQKVTLSLKNANVEGLYNFNDKGDLLTTKEKNLSTFSFDINDTVTIVQITPAVH